MAGTDVETINSLGFVEVYGFVAGVEASDAMVKSAKVRVLRYHEINPGMVTISIEGDLAAVQAAVNAGVAAASRVGKVFGSLIIPRPDDDTGEMILDMINGPAKKPAPAKETKNTAKASPSVAVSATDKKLVHAESGNAPEQVSATVGASIAGIAAESATASPIAEVLEFIAKSPKGHTWNEIAKKFPKQSQRLHKELDELVKTGKVAKTGPRYHKSASKE